MERRVTPVRHRRSLYTDVSPARGRNKSRITANIISYQTDAEPLQILRDRFRLIYCHARDLLDPLMEAEELLPLFFSALGSFSAVPFTRRWSTVPYFHWLTPCLAGSMKQLYRRIDEASALDLR